MFRCTSAIAAVAISVSLLLVHAQGASAVTCDGTIGAVTVKTVIVPSGKTCNLEGTTIKDYVVVEEDAALFAINVIVKGNVKAQGAKRVHVRDSRINGDILAHTSRGGSVINSRVNRILFSGLSAFPPYSPGSVRVSDSHAIGNVVIERYGQGAGVSNNRVGLIGDQRADLIISNVHDGVDIVKNIITGDLVCYGNNPQAFDYHNRVYGRDQCPR